MSRVTYRAVYLREQDGAHVLAVDPGDGRVQYPQIPVAQTAGSVGLDTRSKFHRATPNEFRFGDRVDLTIARVDEA